ncbi:MAG: DegT/DnrJ/EryC1/StrS family aminotransferase, partial [Candidatus Bathyarchaeia archaeon]
QKLPDDTEGLKNEIILQRGHVCPYTQAFRVAGAKLIFVGTENKCDPKEVEQKITDRTAAIGFVKMYEHRGAPLEEIQKIARYRRVPMIMDAAYTLPPRENLRRWASMGVDIVCYAGDAKTW